MTKEELVATYNEKEPEYLKPFVDVCRVILDADMEKYWNEKSFLNEMLKQEKEKGNACYKSGNAYWGIKYDTNGELI